MIKNENYVLILGAGAHAPYGFPTGSQLIEKSITLYPKMEKDAAQFKIFGEKKLLIGLLSEELRKTGGVVTLDRFVNINKEFADEARWAAATVLCASEKQCRDRGLAPIEKKGNQDWLKYLFQKMIDVSADGDDLSRFGENAITFITFNYDRFLEYFLMTRFTSIVKYSGITQDEQKKILKKIKIYHVYGKMGYLPELCEDENAEDSMVFGGDHDNPMVSTMDAHMQIDMIFDDRDKSEVLNEAREALRDADRIMFLGFGYDEMNLRLLGAPSIFDGKRIYGTALGWTKNEIGNVRSKLTRGHVLVPSVEMCGDTRESPIIEDCDSLTLLRNYLVPDTML